MQSGDVASPYRATHESLAWVLALTLLGLVTRLFRLGHQSLWIDEYLMIQRASLGEPFRWADVFVNPQGPLPALILRIWSSWFGTTEAALRTPSVIAGALSVPVIMALGRRLDHRAGVWAGVLAALSPFLVWYSQETRHYALAILAAGLAHLLFLRIVDGEKQWRLRFGYGASIWLGLMSNMTFVFLAAAHGLTLVLSARSRIRVWLVSVTPAFLLLAPWIWVALTRNVNLEHIATIGPIPPAEQLRGDSTFSWLGIPYTAFVFFAGYSLGPTLAQLHDAPRISTVLPHVWVILPLTLAAAWLTLRGVLLPEPGAPRRWLITLAFVLPLAAVLLLSWRNAKVFNARYMAVALPLVLATTAAGLAHENWRRPIRAGLVAFALLGPMILSLSNYFTQPAYFREDMRAAGARLTSDAGPGDLILGLGAPQLLRWYYHGEAPIEFAYGVWIRDEAGLPGRLDRWSQGKSAIWLCTSRPWLQDPRGVLAQALEARFGAGETFIYPGVTLRKFQVARERGEVRPAPPG